MRDMGVCAGHDHAGLDQRAEVVHSSSSENFECILNKTGRRKTEKANEATHISSGLTRLTWTIQGELPLPKLVVLVDATMHHARSQQRVLG